MIGNNMFFNYFSIYSCLIFSFYFMNPYFLLFFVCKETVFVNNNTEVYADAFKSLIEYNIYVDVAIIDLWCSHLNLLESWRSSESPRRLFISPAITVRNFPFFFF